MLKPQLGLLMMISKLLYQILNDSGFINFCVDKQIDANEKSYTIISHILLKK